MADDQDQDEFGDEGNDDLPESGEEDSESVQKGPEEEVQVDKEDIQEDIKTANELFGTGEEPEKKQGPGPSRRKGSTLFFNLLAVAAILGALLAIYWVLKKGIIKP